jgi:hypothetical protein
MSEQECRVALEYVIDAYRLPENMAIMALDELLGGGADYFLGPTGIPDRLRLAGEFLNPVGAMEEASVQAVRAADPDLPSGERLGAAGMSAANVALFGIPGVLAARGYLPTTEAVAETLTGIGVASPSVQEAVRRTVERLNQRGPMPTLYSNPLPGMGDNGGPPLVEPYNPLPDLGRRRRVCRKRVAPTLRCARRLCGWAVASLPIGSCSLRGWTSGTGRTIR